MHFWPKNEWSVGPTPPRPHPKNGPKMTSPKITEASHVDLLHASGLIFWGHFWTIFGPFLVIFGVIFESTCLSSAVFPKSWYPTIIGPNLDAIEPTPKNFVQVWDRSFLGSFLVGRKHKSVHRRRRKCHTQKSKGSRPNAPLARTVVRQSLSDGSWPAVKPFTGFRRTFRGAREGGT